MVKKNNFWLLKSEPDVWSIDQQKKAGNKGATWDGIQRFKKNLIDDIDVSAKSRCPLDKQAP